MCQRLSSEALGPKTRTLFSKATKHLTADRLRLIVVPHEPTEQHLKRVEDNVQCTRLSQADSAPDGHLLVDSVGLLLSLYSIADAAFVGGGFGAGVHSVTEAVGSGLPSACGPRISRSHDASSLAEAGLLTVIDEPEKLKGWIETVVLDQAGRERSGCRSETTPGGTFR